LFGLQGGAGYLCCRQSNFVFKRNNMTYTAHITVMPLKDLLDPQGKAVLGGLANLGLTQVTDVRIGKHITLQVEADSAEQAKAVATEAAQKVLANAVMEYFEVVVA
jgi:phosphoribosylformylglycinamidine synthase